MSFALVALVAFSAFGTSSAFALAFELAEWLVGGAAVGKEIATLAEGELLLEDKVAKNGVTCSGYLDGAVGTERANLSNIVVTKVLNLAEKEILELSGEALLCRSDPGGPCEANDIEVWPIHLPWLLEAELDAEEGSPWVLVISGNGGQPGYEFSCLVAGIKITDACTVVAGSGNDVENAAGGVETIAGTVIEPLGTCTLGGAESGIVEAEVDGLLTAPGAGVLSISTP